MAITNPDGSIVLETTIDTEGIKKGTADLRSEAAKLAAAYRKAGMSKSEAMAKTWQEVRKLAGETEKATEKTKKYGDETVKSGKKIQSSLKGILTELTALVGVYQLISFAKQSVQIASDLEEVQNVVDTAFGEMSYKIEEFSKTSIEQFGLSELSAKQWSSTMVAMGSGMGQALGEGSDKAIELTARLADVMSFYNKTKQEAFTLGKSIYSGETEPLKNIGIVMTENNLALFAMSKGYKQAYKEMDSANKLLVRQEYFLEQTALAAGDYVRTQDGWANKTRTLSERWKEVKIQFGETFKAVGTLVLPVINAVIKGLGYIAQLLQSLSSGVYKLFTGQELFAKETENAKDQINGAVGEQEELTEEIEKSKKAQDKFLAGFDDLQKASANMSESFEDAKLDTGFESNVPQLNLGEGKGTNELEKKKDDIIRILGEMGGYIAGALVAIGLILLVSGQIPWGLGFILAGAVTYKVSKVAQKSGYDTEAVTKALKEMAPIIAGALVAIGLILLFLGQIGWGVGYVIAGAALYAVTQKAWTDDDGTPRSVEDKLAIIGEAVSLGLVAIGVMLIFLGNIPLGLGFIVGGYTLLDISEQQLSRSNIETDIKQWAKENHKIIERGGRILTILGVLIMAFSATHFAKGVSIMVAGMSMLYESAELNRDNGNMGGTFEQFANDNIGLITTSGALLTIMGLILVCTGNFLTGAKVLGAGLGFLFAGEEASGGGVTQLLNEYILKPLEEIAKVLCYGIPQLIVNALVLIGNAGIAIINELIDLINIVLPKSLEIGHVSKLKEVNWLKEETGKSFSERMASSGWGDPDTAILSSVPKNPEKGMTEAEKKAITSGFSDNVPHTTIIQVDGVELARVTENGRRVELERTGSSSLIAPPMNATRLN